MKKKRLILVVILAIIMIIAIVSFIVIKNNRTQKYVDENIEESNSTENVSSVDINESENENITSNPFNSQFDSYMGNSILGSDLKNMVDILIANAETYEDEAEYLPTIDIEDENEEFIIVVHGENLAVEDINAYVDGLNELKEEIDDSYYYSCGANYNDAGLVSEIVISYIE